MDESMAGLEGWTFPEEFCLIDGDLVVARWMNRLPGRRGYGTDYEASDISTL